MLNMTPMIADQQLERIVAGGAPLRRTAEFEELFRELVEEAGRALEEGDLERLARQLGGVAGCAHERLLAGHEEEDR